LLAVFIAAGVLCSLSRGSALALLGAALATSTVMASSGARASTWRGSPWW